MKQALIVLGVVAVVVLTLGAFNRELVLDVDYAFGVWPSVNAFWLFAIAAALIVAVGFLAAVIAQARAWRLRGKLEKELLEVYRRLRAVEAEAEQDRTDLAVLSAGRTGATGGVTQVAPRPADDDATVVTPVATGERTVTAASPVAAQPVASRPAGGQPVASRPAGGPPDAERTRAVDSSSEAATEVSLPPGSAAEAATEVTPVTDDEAAAEEPTQAGGHEGR